MKYYFIDESGDTTFFNKKKECILGLEGVSDILIIGFIATNDPKPLRQELSKIRQSIITDPYLKTIPSIKKTSNHFHAKDDCPEVREKVFKTLKELDFKAQFIVARKKLEIFTKRHKKDEDLFYGEIISHLLERVLHKDHNTIYFSKRSTKTKQAYFQKAVDQAILRFENKNSMSIESDTKVFVQVPSDEPCLQIIDYMNWAIQRAFIKGETRYFNFLKEKISFICDIYDFEKYPKNFYSKRNVFDIKKISPL